MNCEECSKMMFDYVWGTLDVSTAASFKAHLDSGCVACNDELELLQGPSYALAGDLALVIPPVDYKDHVMSLVGGASSDRRDANALPADALLASSASSEKVVQLSHTTPHGTNSSWKKWALALAGCFIGMVCGYAAVHSARTGTSELSREDTAQHQNNTPGIGPGIRMVKLASTGSGGDKGTQAAGQVVFDLVANQVHILTSNLLDSLPTTDYDVWLSDDKNQNYLLGKLEKSDKKGVWFNNFDLPRQVMNVDQIAIARSGNAKSELQEADVLLRVRVAPPVSLK